ncbi:MAG: histidinol-phosphate transaminase [Thermosynechococcaceae cyanobacterium MS004]|nr:histidinol-phosphate transaminase [Thermosynechococcaceae cyanobacterium MS004]
MLPFLRTDLTQLNAYTPHPEAPADAPQTPIVPIDRLDTNECPYDLPEDLKQKLAWIYQHQTEANRYPDGSYAALKAAIAAYVTESSQVPVQVGAAQISVGNGSDELIRSLLIATCLGGQGSILVANPTFSMYGILAQTLGIPVVSIPRTESFALNLTAAQAALNSDADSPSVRAVFVVHPNSPTGNALTEAELHWLRQLPDAVMVVIDEAYFEFSQHTLVSELAAHPNWVILRTFSKAFRLAAHRVGYAIAHPALIQVLEKVRLPYNLPAFSQAAAQLALTHRHTLLQSVPELLQERSRLYDALRQLEELTFWPSQANFIYGRMSNHQTASQSELDSAHAALGQGLKNLGTSIRTTGGGLRITVGSPAENDRTLQRLQQYLSRALPSASSLSRNP